MADSQRTRKPHAGWSAERRAKLMATLQVQGIGVTTTTCLVCGKVFSVAPSLLRKRTLGVLCSRACFSAQRAATAKAKYRVKDGDRIHRKVAEAALGKPLPDGAEVHHHDGDGTNNTNRNLVICQDHAYHMLLEMRARIVRAGGDPDVDLMCSACKRPCPRTEFYIRKARNGQAGRPVSTCKACTHRSRRCRAR